MRRNTYQINTAKKKGKNLKKLHPSQNFREMIPQVFFTKSNSVRKKNQETSIEKHRADCSWQFLWNFYGPQTFFVRFGLMGSWWCGNSRNQRQCCSAAPTQPKQLVSEETRGATVVWKPKALSVKTWMETGTFPWSPAGCRMQDGYWTDEVKAGNGGMIECWFLDALGQTNWLNVPSEDFSSSFQLKCCGFTNYTDFMGSKFEKENQGNLPPSCCWTNSSPCRPGEAQRSNVQVRKP